MPSIDQTNGSPSDTTHKTEKPKRQEQSSNSNAAQQNHEDGSNSNGHVQEGSDSPGSKQKEDAGNEPTSQKPADASSQPAKESPDSKFRSYRVTEFAEEGSTDSQPGKKIIASIAKEDVAADQKTLGGIRSYLSTAISAGQSFCYPDGSPARDETTISRYFSLCEESATDVSVQNFIYVKKKAPIVVPPASIEHIFTKKPYTVVVKQWSLLPGATEPTTVDKGTISDKTFDSAAGVSTDVGRLTLAGLRKSTKAMSSFSGIDKFCTSDGSTVDDERRTFAEYLGMMPNPAASAEGGPNVINIYFKRNQTFNNPTQTGGGDNTQADPNIKVDMTMTDRQPAKTADQFQAQQRSSILDDKGDTTGAGELYGAGYLTEAEWSGVLRNCGVFYGWVVDRRTNRISRAPKPAFKLKSKVDKDPVSSIPDYGPPPPPKYEKPTTSVATVAPKKAEQPKPKPVRKPKPATDDSKSIFDTPNEVRQDGLGSDDALSQGKSLLGGLPQMPDNIPDSAPASQEADSTSSDNAAATTTTTAAPVATKAPPPPAASTTAPTQAVQAPASQADSSQAASADPSQTDGTVQPTDGSDQPLATPPVVSAKTDVGIPNFRVNDDSKIEITACEHEFEVSMARNDFSSQSTEASMSGGFAGFSVSVSAGYSKSQSSSTKTTNNQYQKTIVARYLFPRCDLFLYPDDLEPSPELATAIKNLAVTKNIKDLRKIQADFGHLFCQNLTLGGRLMTSKIMQSTSTQSEQEQKEQMKVSVGVSVNTPYGGGSVKHEQEKGTDTSQSQTQKSTDEKNVFEAVGGDTILASNPMQWSATVAKSQFWRVISRDGLSPIADAIAGMKGYEYVKSYFVQAVPTLSKYVELDESRAVYARLNLQTPNTALSLDNKPGPKQYYFGHRKGISTTPKSTYVVGGTRMLEDSSRGAIFKPASYLAPVLLGYTDNQVGDANQYGIKYTPEYTETEWKIIAPFSENLTHGARVVLLNRPYVDPNAPETDVPADAPESHVVVFRNQQGIFLLGMSETDTYHYFRVLKDGCNTPGTPISESDNVRFAWCFADQTTGFRDYVGDVFGRRRTVAPPELGDGILYMKLPWPRFESLTTDPQTGRPPPNSMLMAPIQQTGSALMSQPLRDGSGQFNYMVQDVSFRLDLIGNLGFGDTGDYMLRDVKQGGVMPPPLPAAWIFQHVLEKRTKKNGMWFLHRMFFL